VVLEQYDSLILDDSSYTSNQKKRSREREGGRRKIEEGTRVAHLMFVGSLIGRRRGKGKKRET
jgi:hypothetical protein